ncbi:MAG: 2-hydroxy-acid oxidase [Rhodospirillaceae bacterium]|nr:2-hydroxy-acid oxidase [Rhodospirillaceae bacterium]
MSQSLKPRDSKDLESIIGDALVNRTPLEIIGGGSKRAIGQLMPTKKEVSLSALSGITLYEPKELVLSAYAGTPLEEIESVLGEHNQHLAFEPINLSHLFFYNAVQTIGGVISTNLAGPRRIYSGAPRDHLLGATMITGRGETIKTGGRVVKNVTGYDLCKLFAGSYGTLAAATKLTMKVLPVGSKIRTVLISLEKEKDAVSAMIASLQSPYEVSGASFITSALTRRSEVSYIARANSSIVGIRIEGSGPSVNARCSKLKNLLMSYGDIQELHYHNSMKFWQEVANVSPYKNKKGAIWRISVVPSMVIETVNKIIRDLAVEYYLDWGGGLIWLRLIEDRSDAGARTIRNSIEVGKGHATLIRATEDIRAQVPVFQPQASGIRELSKRIKESFDPAGILNPNKMVHLLEAHGAN